MAKQSSVIWLNVLLCRLLFVAGHLERCTFPFYSICPWALLFLLWGLLLCWCFFVIVRSQHVVSQKLALLIKKPLAWRCPNDSIWFFLAPINQCLKSVSNSDHLSTSLWLWLSPGWLDQLPKRSLTIYSIPGLHTVPMSISPCLSQSESRKMQIALLRDAWMSFSPS